MPAAQTTVFKDKGTNSPVRADALLDRPLPYNQDAEEGLVACCLKDVTGEALSACIEGRMGPDSFHRPTHQIIFNALSELHKTGDKIDEIILAEYLQSTDQLEEVGGLPALYRLTSRIETTAHGTYWMKIVQEKHVMRTLIRTATSVIDRAYSSPSDLEGFLGEVEQEILDVNQDRVTEGAQPISVSMDKAVKLVTGLLNNETTVGVLTGFRDLDKYTHGLQPAEMIVLAARPSMGKTSLALNIAEEVVFSRSSEDEDKSVLVFSLEMSATQLATRLLCGRARVDMQKLRDGFASKTEEGKLAKTAGELMSAGLWIDDSASMSIHEMRAKARRRHAKSPLKLIIIDYLQLIMGSDSRTPREQQIAEISRGTKAMAKELSVPVLVLSQLNRDSEKEKRDPRLSDLRESGSIEQDADVVMLLGRRREEAFGGEQNIDNPSDSSDLVKLILAKQRNGPTASIDLHFLRQYTRFESAKKPFAN
ncbi:MAG: replicative DNA helicase [Opitutales bacterium]|nr:replicative DNA helicase [Opitutales bacterium]|tara:strand:+ start:130 stop:1566 length:1437 start_codon:yes stop_codon:yes gene_type:complete